MRIAFWTLVLTVGYLAPGWAESGSELSEHDTKGAGPAYLSQVVTVTENSASNAAAIKSIQADCPAGTSVIGGSGQVHSNDPVIDGLTLFASRPLDLPAQGWFAAAYASVAGSGDWELEVGAICADIDNVQRVSAQTADDSNDFKTENAFCPAGTRVLGGGARISDVLLPSNLTLAGSYPISGSPNGWSGRAHELSVTSETWSLQVYALCADVANPVQILFNSFVVQGERVEVEVDCPSGSTAIGGGANIPITTSGPIVLQELSIGQTFRAVYLASSPISGPWRVNAYGICITF